MQPSLSPMRLALLAGFVILAAAVPYILGAIGQSFLIGSATRIVIYAIAASSLNLILGYGGMVSFGHAAFFGIGAYVTGILSFHLYEGSAFLELIPGTNAALVAWPASILVAASFALVIGALSLRTSGVYFIMITLAFAQMLFFLFVSLERYGGDDGFMMFDGRSRLPGLDLDRNAVFYYVCLGLLLVWLAGFHLVVQSRFGRILQGCRINESRMRALGCATYRYKLAAFVLAGAVAGLAGALQANLTEFVSPDALHWTRSGDLLVIVILGGMGTLFGPVAGSILYLLLEEFLPIIFRDLGLPLLQEHWRVVFGPMLILLVLFLRRGVYGTLLTARTAP